MFSLRTHAIISGALFAAIVLLAVGGNALIAAGVVRQPTTPSPLAMGLFFGLFLAFGFSAIPVMVKLVVRGHQALGTDGKPLIRNIVAAQNLIIWVIWGILALGLVVAIPAAVRGGLFDMTSGPPPAQSAPS
jgi:hypothetical protein